MNRNDTYDPMGSRATVTLNGNAVSSYTYDDAGNRTRVDFGNGTWQTFSYGNDARYLMTGIDYAYKCDSNDTIANKGGIRVTRSNGGNPLSWADNTDKFIKTFSYDTQGRLANADIPGVSRTDFSYDWVSNRTSPTAVYNDADQLTSYNGNTYSYESEGGMYTGAGRTFGYYSNGDPYQVSLNGVSKNGKFDPHGLREVTYGAATTKYSYDITASIPAMISEGPNDGTTTYFYVREPNGELIMRKSGTDYKYYHFDELGSTLFLTDANGIQTDKYVYNAWGKVVSSSGSTVNPYRYVGRYGYYYDTETNLYLLGKRYYDADAGVFCQRDAAKDGKSYYSYSSGHPLTGIDPTGKIWCKRTGIWPFRRIQCHFGDLPKGEVGWQVPLDTIQEWYQHIRDFNDHLPPCRRLRIPNLDYLFQLITVADLGANTVRLIDTGRICGQTWLDNAGSGGDDDNMIWRETIIACDKPGGPGSSTCKDSYLHFINVCTKSVFGCNARQIIEGWIGLLPY